MIGRKKDLFTDLDTIFIANVRCTDRVIFLMLTRYPTITVSYSAY